MQVRELDWSQPEQLEGFTDHYDLIIATDCVYHEHLIHDLLRVMLHCADLKTKGAHADMLHCCFTFTWDRLYATLQIPPVCSWIVM
jgi:hypothetical protein